jgi:hypothetical protein
LAFQGSPLNMKAVEKKGIQGRRARELEGKEEEGQSRT